MANFDELLAVKLKRFASGIDELEHYEFCYALKNLQPEAGWDTVRPAPMAEIEKMAASHDFYAAIETKKKVNDKIVLDRSIVELTRMLFVGLVNGDYPDEWIDRLFFFDIRGFLFLHRTVYFTPEVVSHFGGRPYKQFETKQRGLAARQEVTYREFSEANREVDQAFIDAVVRLIALRGTPIVLTLAGPTAAGKTEITARLFQAFAAIGKKITTLEMDNFFIDRDIRGEGPIGDDTTHLGLFKEALAGLLQAKRVSIPRYDFINATSSHDVHHNLKPGCKPLEIDPADVIFIEGNFPFQIEGVSDLIGIKVVYLTDDPIRFKRKWWRDIDLRKKYDPVFFVNRYFKTQFLRAEDIYAEQMQCCDLLVDTTGAALWATPKIQTELEG